MPPRKLILNLEDSHQQLLSYLPSKRLKTNDEEKENNIFNLFKNKLHHLKVTFESSIVGYLYTYNSEFKQPLQCSFVKHCSERRKGW